jgi:hypothetical protein
MRPPMNKAPRTVLLDGIETNRFGGLWSLMEQAYGADCCLYFVVYYYYTSNFLWRSSPKPKTIPFIHFMRKHTCILRGRRGLQH